MTREKTRIFLSVVIYVVKAAFVPFSATGENPANAGVARLSGISPCPVPDTAHGTPKPGAIPVSLYPDMRVSADKHSAIIAKAAGECKHFLILKKN